MRIKGLNFPPDEENAFVVQPVIRTPLESMLRTCGIASLQDIEHYVEACHADSTDDQLDISLPAMDGRFRVVTAGDLEFGNDSEHRLFEERVVGRDAILHVNGMRLRNSNSVEFTNCVFTGNLHISMTERTLSKVYLDSCLVLGKVVIDGVDSGECSVTVNQVNCFEMDARGVHVKSLHISQCKIPVLHLQNSSADDVFLRGNDVAYARVCRNRFETARIDHEQFNLRMMGGKAPVVCDPKHAPEGFFERMRRFSPGNTDREDLFETLTFLRKHTALESDRRALNTVRLIESSQYQHSFWARMTVATLGWMQYPSLIILIALATLFLFAVIYWGLPIEFMMEGSPHHIGFSSACYFSGVTMTTVGYGDVTPLGFARCLSVIEAILGVTLWGLFVVALVRRYID